ncbi:hypothetical protein [Microcoleus sp. PH2017_08_TRC_O_A]|jgi:hypothetical protein|uniref:hypothetical protein n=1 Tax=Microcoleus sp. PH2017_08_TRC_O_A TaxID=2798819 RepID=UPI001E09FFAF|nr:hypothetical protein [Microcoleus sp. PH2017_08_TRC_O_A]MCC3454625.1 hypothetical protein [Microcoleus sp. PH2017_08_TRC_O_A]MCC3510692.1 hypothetical protein [Microcoleus sp. PH2017_17_BER_D_A]
MTNYSDITRKTWVETLFKILQDMVKKAKNQYNDLTITSELSDIESTLDTLKENFIKEDSLILDKIDDVTLMSYIARISELDDDRPDAG